MFNNLFGEDYANKVDIFQNLYLRVMFLRGGVFDFPLFILVCYLIPWDNFYHYPLVQHLIHFMESNIANVSDNRAYSDFPEFAVTYLSIIHSLGFVSLILPFIFSVESKRAIDQILKKKINYLKIILCGVLSVILFVLMQLYSGAITYFGCEECSYHYPLSLIAGAIIVWVCIHYCLMATIIFCRAVIFIKRSE